MYFRVPTCPGKYQIQFPGTGNVLEKIFPEQKSPLESPRIQITLKNFDCKRKRVVGPTNIIVRQNLASTQN